MSIVTSGLGGNCLITQGFGWWHKVKEAIKAVVSRLIPRKRKHFEMRVRVTGDLISPFEQTVIVEGEKDFRRVLWELIEDESDEDE